MAIFPILNDFGVGAKCRSTQAAGINTSSGMKRACSGNTISKGMGLDPIFIALPLAMTTTIECQVHEGVPGSLPKFFHFSTWLFGCPLWTSEIKDVGHHDLGFVSPSKGEKSEAAIFLSSLKFRHNLEGKALNLSGFWIYARRIQPSMKD